MMIYDLSRFIELTSSFNDCYFFFLWSSGCSAIKVSVTCRRESHVTLASQHYWAAWNAVPLPWRVTGRARSHAEYGSTCTGVVSASRYQNEQLRWCVQQSSRAFPLRKPSQSTLYVFGTQDLIRLSIGTSRYVVRSTSRGRWLFQWSLQAATSGTQSSGEPDGARSKCDEYWDARAIEDEAHRMRYM
jgi:hypothetical protein